MNYEELGFKCGLEIHQQLEGKKLFCDCPTIIKKEEADFSFRRRLRASAGESGNVDKAALFEMQKSKVFEYHGYNECCCLVELDEEPPHPVNHEALVSALIVAKLLNMNIVDKVQFMRKTVVDGSNVSGFQRTALIGFDGFIEVNKRKIRIETLCLEEESAQAIKRSKKKDEYNISRLGIPLIEIATAPDIISADECRDVAAHLGMILRSLPNCKRGIGSIRQDVNISIKGGNRVELKGFQDVRKIPVVIKKEVRRHLDLLKNGKEVEKEVRKVEQDNSTSFLRPMPGADRMYPETDVEPILTNNIKLEVPETLEQRTTRYQKSFGLSNDLALKVTKQESKSSINFEEIFKKYSSKNLSPTNIADFYLSQVPNIEGKEKKKISDDSIKKILLAFSKGDVAYSSVKELIVDALNGKLDFSNYKQMGEEEIRRVVKKILSENKEAPIGLLMGKIMSELRGRADGKLVKRIVDELIK